MTATIARRDPLSVQRTFSVIVGPLRPGIRFNEHIEGGGLTVFAHACKLGLEGIVSKRKDSTYRSGRSPDWLKSKIRLAQTRSQHRVDALRWRNLVNGRRAREPSPGSELAPWERVLSE